MGNRSIISCTFKLHDAAGTRGSGVLADCFEKNYLELLKRIPDNWVAVKKISGENDSFRCRDLTIYYIPQ